MNIEITPLNIIIAVVLLYFVYTYCIKNSESFLYEPKFPPIQVRELKDVCTKKNSDKLTTQYEHNARNTGFAPIYHNQQTVRYLPSWPNVMDNYDMIDNIPDQNLIDQNESPVFITSNKVNVDDILY